MGVANSCTEPFALRRLREVAFERVAEDYAKDAKRDFRRALTYAIVASILLVAGPVLGTLLIEQGGGGLGPGIASGMLFVISSTPLWWLVDRCRRSGVEHQRLARHMSSVEPFLEGCDPQDERQMRAAIAQRVFARPEGSDFLASPTWPAVVPSGESAKDQTT